MVFQRAVMIMVFMLPLTVAAQVEGLKRCATIAADEARLACFDALAEQVGVVRVQVVKSEASISESLPVDPVKSTSEEVARQVAKDDEKREELQSELAQLDAKSYTLTISALLKDARGKDIFVTKEGVKYKNVSSKRSQFRVGDVLKTEQGVMGSTFLVSESGLRIKVKRIN